MDDDLMKKFHITEGDVDRVGEGMSETEECAVPTGCRDREEWVVREIRKLSKQWVMGNRDFVHDRLMEMPKSVAIAVSAGIQARFYTRFDTGMKERA